MADPITTLNATDSLPGQSLSDLNQNFTRRRWLDRTATGTTPYTVLSTDECILYTAAAASVINLPSASSFEGRELWIIAVAASSANTITVTPNGSDTVGDAASQALNGNGELLCLMSDGSANWIILVDNR